MKLYLAYNLFYGLYRRPRGFPYRFLDYPDSARPDETSEILYYWHDCIDSLLFYRAGHGRTPEEATKPASAGAAVNRGTKKAAGKAEDACRKNQSVQG